MTARLASRLQRAITQRTRTLAPAMRTAWFRGVKDLRVALGNDLKLARLIEFGRIDALLTDDTIDRALVPLRREVAKSARAGWNALDMPEGAREAGVAFTTASPRVLSAMRTLDEKLLAPMGREIQETVRQAVEVGLREGKNPRAIARDLKGVIGLAPNQADAVRNFEAALREGKVGKALGYQLRDKRFDATLRGGKALPEGKITAMVTAYRTKFEAFHAQTIARTATLNAYRAGQHASVQDAIARGILDPQRTTKTWATVGDDRVRDEHLGLEGETVPMDQVFSNGLQYPQEYNCRCQAVYRLTPSGSTSAAAATEPPAPRATGSPALQVEFDQDIDIVAVHGEWLFDRASRTAIPMEPDAFVRQHFAGVDAARYRIGDVRVDPQAVAVPSSPVVLSANVYEGDTLVATIKRLFTRRENGELQVEHVLFTVEPDYSGKGLAKEYLAGAIEQYRAMGVTRVTTHANIDVGGYAWARYGFVPRAGDWSDLLAEFEAAFQRKGLVDKYGLLTPRGRTVGKDEVDLFRSLRPDHPEDIRVVADSAFGKSWLLDTDWYGALDLADAPTVNRFTTYAKKKK